MSAPRAVAVAAVLTLSLLGCSGDAPAPPTAGSEAVSAAAEQDTAPVGYLGADETSVLYLRWTPGQGGQLQGSAQLAKASEETAGSEVQASNATVTGTLAGEAISFQVGGLIGQTWLGTLRGDD